MGPPGEGTHSPPPKRAKSPREFDLRSPPRVQAPVYRAAPVGSPPIGGGRSVDTLTPRVKAPPPRLTARLLAERRVPAAAPSPSASVQGVPAAAPRDGTLPSVTDKVSASNDSDLEAEIRNLDQHLEREKRQLQKEKIKASQLEVKSLERQKKRLNDSLASRSSRDSRSFCGTGASSYGVNVDRLHTSLEGISPRSRVQSVIWEPTPEDEQLQEPQHYVPVRCTLPQDDPAH